MNHRSILLGIIVFLSISFHSVAQPSVGPCQIFPSDNYWNQNISAEPVHPQSAAIISTINGFGGDNVHPDFGGETNDWYGIPWITVTGAQEVLTKKDNAGDTDGDIVFEYDDESGESPYPIPHDVPVEGGPDSDGDRHVIVINTDNCILSELYYAYYVGLDNNVPNGDGIRWTAGSGAYFDLNTNSFWTETWTSADAAGLPIFPGLARCDEVMSGEVNHAFRFTTSRTRNTYIFPASHKASNYTDALYPPMGMRIRLKANYDISGFDFQAQVIATAMKEYGMILADNGSNWFFSGEYNPNCWEDDELNDLKSIPGTAFEVLAYPGSSAPSLYHFSTSTVTLRWGRLPWASSYEVQVANNSAFTGATSYPVSATNIIIPGMAEGLSYWRVRGLDATAKPGAWSSTGSFTVST